MIPVDSNWDENIKSAKLESKNGSCENGKRVIEELKKKEVRQ